MKVKIISNNQQEFNGVKYYRCGKYFANSSKKHNRRLHRTVWEYHNGKIPKGCIVDHIDRDSDNNQIENLRLATYSMNNRNVSEETTKRRKANMERIRPLAIKWHKSKSGREWHKEHGKKVWENIEPVKKICACCGKEFETKVLRKNVRFCCRNCQHRAYMRRKKGLPEQD